MIRLSDIQVDKVNHFYWGATLGIPALWLGLLGMIPVIVAAIGKEIWDARHPPHRAELYDVIATVLGGSFTTLAVYLRAHTGWL